jgi:SAM-dependent methyltransferase
MDGIMTETGADELHWTRVAEQWIAWARSPGHDAFWAYRDHFTRFVGSGSGRALEVGCGEGRVSRELKALGYRVTATDAVAAMVEAAKQADSADEYRVASAGALPFDDEQFDLVMAYNVLMDVEDVPAALREIRRVMKRDGMLFISLVHPFRDRGRFAGPEADAAFVVEGSYYGRDRFEGEERHGGLSMHFAGWSQPLEDYMAALEQAGLAVVALREPVPDDGADDRLSQCRRIPLFLWLKARVISCWQFRTEP